MDIDDTIQQLLNTTGWSCDDLLEQLQRYKAQKDKKDRVETGDKNSSSEDLTKETEENGENSHVACNDENSAVENSAVRKSSNTEEEKDEILVTCGNIIDKIIDKSVVHAEEVINNTQSSNEEQEEITEVRVIEVDDDEEDDCFEEEGSHVSTRHHSNKIEYLETFPRRTRLEIEAISLIDSDDKSDSSNEKRDNEEEISKSNENFFPEENPETVHFTNIGNSDISKTNLENAEIERKDDDRANDSKSEQTTEKCSENKADETGTTMIYKKNCEKILNSNIKANDCDDIGEKADTIRSEHLYNSPLKETRKEDDDQENREEEHATLENLEDIRNNLKEQLNCLRTRKKGHFLQPLRPKLVNPLEFNKKALSNANPDKNSLPQKPNTKCSDEITDCFKKPSETIINEDKQGQDLYTQTNEFGLVILSVEGGIDFTGQNKKNTENSNQELDVGNDSSNTFSSALENSVDSNSIFSKNKENDDEPNETGGVFEEIRRIIRKQKQSCSTSDKEKATEVSAISNFNFFSGSINSAKAIDPNSKSISISADNSQSSFTNDETSQNNDKNSPFVSNTLDEFLTGNSKLNISYKVPKSGAEEGLIDNYREKSPLVLKKIVETDKDDAPVVKKIEKFKAKTVAQKRKLLERQRLKELRRQGKILNKQSENKLSINNTNKVQDKCSYIEINNEKLWVKGTKPNTCVAKIKTSSTVSPPPKQHIQKKKLSLLTELTKKHSEKIKYLPGPLCKKSNLQVSGHDNWSTETKLLPKITLEVTPKIGERLPPSIIAKLPRNNGIITPDLAEFALSVLKTKNDTANEEKTFKFPMKFANNQEQIIIKKQRVIPIKFNVEEKDNKEKSVDSVVANVLDDLIRYVEIKEIAPTLIKEDEFEYDHNDKELDKMPAIAENISSIFKKPQKKKSKVELELMRLSCKVVNVEVEENSAEESCDKSYCRLGCVCKSLKCDGMISYHCQNVGCMLGCTCPREKSIEYDKLMLPAGTDILSRDTVTRIEDEAKKDLAKVEREFTQMVIHTNDKTIVVGTGGRHKTRRSTKTPVKYSDYIDSNFESMENEKGKSLKKNDFIKECFVKLEKLNLQDIVPYCMFHNSYNCHCGGKSLSPVKHIPKRPVVKNILPKCTTDKTGKNLAVDKKHPKKITSSPKIQKESSNYSDISSSENDPETKMSTSGRPIRIKKKMREDFTYSNELDFYFTSCSRTMGVSFDAKTHRRLSVKTLNKITKGDFINNITQSEVLKAKVLDITPDTLEADILKHQLILDWELFNKSNSLLAEIAINENRHKRKQILEVRNDDKPLFNQDLAIQRRKKHLAKKTPVVESVFEGEIIVDERYMELLQKMGSRTVMEGYARLLPWTALIKSFNKNDIKIWCMIDQPSRLLINKGDKTPPKNYVDIRLTTQTTEVIRWILTGKLPTKYPEEHVSFILKQTKDNYEICGLCTKNLSDTSPPNDTSSPNNTNNEKELSSNVDPEKDTALFKHKDLNGVQQVLYLSKGKFQLQELMEENLEALGEKSVEKSKLYMWAALPEIYKMCKWRMVFLNSDFTFLYFTKVKYSIKYTDLRNASNTAKNSNCTVILRNSTICSPYDHSGFGIYFDGHYQDRLFIGPYFKQYKDNDIETLRYINQSLVCTESFSKMQGKNDYKCGHWLVERPYNRLSVRPTIDLTSDTSCGRGLKRKIKPDLPHIVKKFKSPSKDTGKIIVTQNNELIKVMDSVPKKPEEFNRYIITNIPHLGYLGAFQHENSTEIDVSWPFENKMLRFPNVISAINFLQCRLSSLLQPVPETFKISIIVLTQIDLEKTKPIDASILSGHYICGEFGCYNIKTITSEFCVSKIGTTRSELMKIFAKRAQLFIKQKVEELADMANIPKTEESRHDIVNILEKARGEIEELKKKDKECTLEKNDLLLKKRELALKAFRLISFLPEKERNLESWKFRQILRKQSILVPKTVVEPIEIPDSDEEEQSGSNQNESSTNQDLKSVPSNTLASDSSATVPPDKQGGASNSLTVVTNVPKVRQSIITYPPQRKLKSILKTNTISSPTPSTSKAEPPYSLTKDSASPTTIIVQNEDASVDFPKQPYLTGIKLVRTSEGKLVLVSDDQPAIDKPFKFKSAGGKQLIIKDNKILSVKSIKPQKTNTPNIVLSPTNKIILNKTSLADNSQTPLKIKTSLADNSQTPLKIKTSLADNSQTPLKIKTSLADNSQMPPKIKISLADNSQTLPKIKTSLDDNSQMPPKIKTSLADNSLVPPKIKTSLADNSQTSPKIETSLADNSQTLPKIKTSLADNSQTHSKINVRKIMRNRIESVLRKYFAPKPTNDNCEKSANPQIEKNYTMETDPIDITTEKETEDECITITEDGSDVEKLGETCSSVEKLSIENPIKILNPGNTSAHIEKTTLSEDNPATKPNENMPHEVTEKIATAESDAKLNHPDKRIEPPDIEIHKEIDSKNKESLCNDDNFPKGPETKTNLVENNTNKSNLPETDTDLSGDSNLNKNVQETMPVSEDKSSECTEKLDTTANSCDVTKKNYEKNFLANDVSETFPSESENCEVPVQDNSASAAALTQTNAANENLPLKKFFNISPETRDFIEQNRLVNDLVLAFFTSDDRSVLNDESNSVASKIAEKAEADKTNGDSPKEADRNNTNDSSDMISTKNGISQKPLQLVTSTNNERESSEKSSIQICNIKDINPTSEMILNGNDSTNLNLLKDIDQHSSTENPQPDMSEVQSISNVDPGVSIKVGNDTIKEEGVKANINLIKNINISVSGQISAGTSQNKPKTITETIAEINDESALKFSSNDTVDTPSKITKKVLPKTKKFRVSKKNCSKKPAQFKRIYKQTSSNDNTNRFEDTESNTGVKSEVPAQKSCEIGQTFPITAKSDTVSSEIPKPNNLETQATISVVQGKPEKCLSESQNCHKTKRSANEHHLNGDVKLKREKKTLFSVNELNKYKISDPKEAQTSEAINNEDISGKENLETVNCELESKEENENKQISFDRNKMWIRANFSDPNSAVAKCPLSKKISNVIVHTLQISPDNAEYAKENTHPDTDTIVQNTELQSTREETGFPFEGFNTNLLSHSQDTNTIQNSEENEEKTEISYFSESPKTASKRAIKCLNPKVNAAFTIEKNSFLNVQPQDTQNPINKLQTQQVVLDSNSIIKYISGDSPKEEHPLNRSRIGNDRITAQDLVQVREIFKKGRKWREDIMAKIYAWAESVNTQMTTNQNHCSK